MRYSEEFKRKSVELYREGKWPETPEGIKDPNNFRQMIRRWAKTEEWNGPEVFKHKESNKKWTAEEKLELVAQVRAGNSCNAVAQKAGINNGLLYSWVRKYKEHGYNGLINKTKGRPSKESEMQKPLNPKPLTESEREELLRLREENAYIKAENAVIKKEIALREEKWDEQLKAKKHKSSRNSGK